MRSIWTTTVAAITSLVLVPSLAAADDVSEQLRQLQERLASMEDRLQATQDQLENANETIEAARLGENERSASNALSSFLETTEFSGSIATSYFYNITNTGSGGAGPAGGNGNNAIGGMNVFHPDHNSIQLDEVWLSMSRAATEESRVGFGIDLVFGAKGEVVGNAAFVGGGNGFWLNQGYIEYLTPWGATLSAGKFMSHIGYEVAGPAAANLNIGRGLTYSSMQPFSQIGARLSGESNGLSWMVGIVNGLAENQVDVDGVKDFIAQLGWGTDTMTVLLNGQYGGDAEAFGGFGKDDALLLNGIVELTPTDMLVAYLGVTWNRVFADDDRVGGGPRDADAVGVAVGGRLGVTDRLGIASRIEWATVEDDSGIIAHPLLLAGGGATENDLLSATGTVDYLLVDGLTLRGEVQYQKVLKSNGTGGGAEKVFDGGTEDRQVLVGAQLVYSF